jgi:hypothetical protein
VDQISPELVLVDPELAAEARAQLPEAASIVQPARDERLSLVEPPSRRTRRRSIRIVAVVGALVVAAAVAAAVVRDEPQPTVRSAQAAAAQEPEESPKAGVLGARKLAPPPTDAHRVYVWAPTDGALYYRVEFLRNGKPFHAAETADPSLRLPATLRLPPGTYRWSVRPATVGAAGVVLQQASRPRTFEVGRG